MGSGGIAIDGAGNVWATNTVVNTTTNIVGNSVTEMIGAARPVLTPQVACLMRTPSNTVCLP